MTQAHTERSGTPGDAGDTLELRNRLTAGRTVGTHAFVGVLRRCLHGSHGELIGEGPCRADVEMAAALAAPTDVESITSLQIVARSLQSADIRLQDIERVRNSDRARRRVAMDRLAEVAAGVLYREVAQVQRVLRTAAELGNGVIQGDIEVIESHHQRRDGFRRQHHTERLCVRTFFLQVRIAARA